MKAMEGQSICTYEQWQGWRHRKDRSDEASHPPVPVSRPSGPSVNHYLRPGEASLTIDVPQVLGYRLVLPEGPISRAPDTVPGLEVTGDGLVRPLDLRADYRTGSDGINNGPLLGSVASELADHLPDLVSRDGYRWSYDDAYEETLVAFVEGWMRSRLDCFDSTNLRDILQPNIADAIGRHLLDHLSEVRLILDKRPAKPFVVGGANELDQAGPLHDPAPEPHRDTERSSVIDQMGNGDPRLRAIVPCDRLGLSIPSTPITPRWRHQPLALLVIGERAEQASRYLVVDEADDDGLVDVESTTLRYWARGLNASGAFGRWDYVCLRGSFEQRLATLENRLDGC